MRDRSLTEYIITDARALESRYRDLDFTVPDNPGKKVVCMKERSAVECASPQRNDISLTPSLAAWRSHPSHRVLPPIREYRLTLFFS